MLRYTQTRIALTLLLCLMGFAYASAQQKAQTLFTGVFHGKVHNTSGHNTVYQETDGRLASAYEL
jgi:hypothetical protein